jgi:hypothetical protein
MNVRQFQGSSIHTTDGHHADIVELGPGEIVPRSGIYQVIHGDEQKGTETTVVAIRGERVERCGSCGEEVRLRLIHAAPHVSEDGDFCEGRDRD